MSDTKKYTKDLIGSGIGPIRMPQPMPMPDNQPGPILVKKKSNSKYSKV